MVGFKTPISPTRWKHFWYIYSGRGCIVVRVSRPSFSVPQVTSSPRHVSGWLSTEELAIAFELCSLHRAKLVGLAKECGTCCNSSSFRSRTWSWSAEKTKVYSIKTGIWAMHYWSCNNCPNGQVAVGHAMAVGFSAGVCILLTREIFNTGGENSLPTLWNPVSVQVLFYCGIWM